MRFVPTTIVLWSCFLTALTPALKASGKELDTSFLRSHCIDCHQGTDAEAGFDLSALDGSLDSNAATSQWVKVVERVEAGEMPPKDSKQPTAAATKEFVRSSTGILNSHIKAQQKSVGRVRGRRLTNIQLERTLHDLLGIDIPLATEMPEEPRTDGFTTVANGQSLSHFQLQTHLAVVDKALDEAFRRATSKPDEWTKELSARQLARRDPRRRCREPEMLNGKAVVWSTRTIFYGRLPVTTAREDGWYRLRIKASALNVPDEHGVWCTVRTGMCVSSAPMLAWAGGFEATEEPNEWTFEAWLPRGHMFEVRPGDSTLKMGRFSGGQIGAGEGTPQKLCGVAHHSAVLERIHKGPGNWQGRRFLFGDLKVDYDRKTKTVKLISSSPKADAKRLITTFAERAFRRPTTAEDIAPFVDLAHRAMDDGQSLTTALRGTYRAILCSPRFMHFYEAPGMLDGFALASRLSYLVWGTMPDKQLLDKAKSGELTKPHTLRRQLERMLEDSRSDNFVKDLAAEWLDLSEIDFTEPDRKLYSGFDVVVQESMLAETHAFLAEMLRNNLSVGNLIDSDFTFLNSRLARYYGIDEVDGDDLQRVQLGTDHRRGGLMTQGAIMKVTANGTNTSPVLRGVWISERLLGVDIPPPPENVPAVEPDIRGAKTIREMLAKHKSSDSCAACHVKIDPPGFALENFDPSGRWRDRYLSVVKGRRSRGAQIDSGFEMPDGTRFDNLSQFQQLVLNDKPALARNVVQKLLTYGTGAACGFGDRNDIEKIVNRCKATDFGFRSLLTEVVASETFRIK